ncbi:pogo transposable element with KRAB domain-like protein [Aphelenchoides avenae]|nr:pogo transposable element with KRAB domain-like protein [Aphelenchus avenae]
MKWIEEEEKLKEAIRTRGKDTKKLSRGRPIKLKEFDTGLAEWIKERRAQKQKITYKLIKQEAAQRLRKIPSGTTLLKLSVGWQTKFLRRHRLPLRKPTSVAQKAPADYAEKNIKITYTEQLRQKEKYKHWVMEAWYDGVTKDNVINSFKACGIGAIGGVDDHLILCLKEGNGIPNGLHVLDKAREAAEARELAEILTGFEIEAPDEDDTGHVSDVEVIDDETAASDEDNSGPEDENHNFNDDSDF